jgi:Ca2+-binding EF-hand superfamily protein
MSVDAAIALIREKLQRKVGGGNQNSLYKAFRVFDQDGSGTIELDEMFATLKAEFMVIFDQKTQREIIEKINAERADDGGADVSEVSERFS